MATMGCERYYIECFSTITMANDDTATVTMENDDTRTINGHCRTASKEVTTTRTDAHAYSNSSRKEKIRIRSSWKAVDRRSGCAGNSTT